MISKSVGNQVGANKCAIDREVMEVTLKPDLQKLCRSNLLMVNYHPHKFRETKVLKVNSANCIANSTAKLHMLSVSVTQNREN